MRFFHMVDDINQLINIVNFSYHSTTIKMANNKQNNDYSIIQQQDISIEFSYYVSDNKFNIKMEILQLPRTQNNITNSQLIYTTLQVEGIHVRTTMRQYQESNALVLYIWGFSCILGVTIPLALVQINLNLGIFPFFIGTGIGFIPLNVLMLCYRYFYSNLFIFWSILTNLTIITLGFQLALELPISGIILSSYCTIQLIATLVLTLDRTILIIKILIYFQLVVVGYKLDGVVGLGWQQILTGFAIILAFITIVALLLMVYSLCGGLFTNNAFFTIRKKGAIFGYFNLLCLGCLIGTVFWNTYIGDNYSYILLGGTFFSWSVIVYTFPNITAITLCFCRIQALKQKQIPKLQKMQQNLIPSLYRASSNWLVPHQNIQNPDDFRQSQQCMGCMSKIANATWMPCGHCIFCFECTENLIKVNMKCGLCKQQPSQILKIDQQIGQLSDKIFSKNMATVVQSYEVRS